MRSKFRGSIHPVRIGLKWLVVVTILLLANRSSLSQPMLTGRFTAGMYGWRVDDGTSGSEPSMRGKLEAEKLFDGNFHGELDLRVRRDIQSDFGQTRLYEAWLGWNPEPLYEVQAGRLGARGFAGAGFLDGGRFLYTTSKQYTYMVFGGIEPDLSTFQIGTHVQKFGVGFERGADSSGNSWGVSLLEQRYDGESDRRLLSQYAMQMLPYNMYVYQNLETDFEWRENGSDKSGLRISSFQVNLSESPTREWRFQQAISYRRNIKPLRSLFDVADTLFESDPVYDFSGGANWRATQWMDVRGDLRWQRRASDGESGISLSTGMNANTMTTVPWYISSNYRFNNNLYYFGHGFDVSVERQIYRELQGRIEQSWESNEYIAVIPGASSTFSRNSTAGSLSWWQGDWSCGGGIELVRSGDANEFRYMLDLGYRLSTGKPPIVK